MKPTLDQSVNLGVAKRRIVLGESDEVSVGEEGRGELRVLESSDAEEWEDVGNVEVEVEDVGNVEVEDVEGVEGHEAGEPSSFTSVTSPPLLTITLSPAIDGQLRYVSVSHPFCRSPL